MPKKKDVSKRTQYKTEYAAAHYKRIPLNVGKEYFESVMKPAAAAAGESMNGYIKKAIQMRIDSGK